MDKNCNCACHDEELIVMDACGCWSPPCCDEQGKPRSKLGTAPPPRPAMEQVAKHTTVGGKGAVGRIRR